MIPTINTIYTSIKYASYNVPDVDTGYDIVFDVVGDVSSHPLQSTHLHKLMALTPEIYVDYIVVYETNL